MATLLLTPTYSGYSTKDANNIVQSKVGGGMPRTQLDLVGGVSVVNLRFVLSPWQYQYWMAFYYKEIQSGSLPFNIDLDIDGYNNTYEVMIVENSIGKNQAYVRGMEVNFQVFAKPIIDNDYMEGVLELYEAYGVDGEDVLNALHQFANIDSNVLIDG